MNVVFVKNNAAQSGNGSFPRPFLTLKEAEAASRPGEVIVILPGDETTTGMDEGIILKDGQRLSGASLFLD